MIQPEQTSVHRTNPTRLEIGSLPRRDLQHQNQQFAALVSVDDERGETEFRRSAIPVWTHIGRRRYRDDARVKSA